jgi:hypothetical protein
MLLSLSKSVGSSYRHLAIIFIIMTVVLTVVRGIFHDAFKDEYLKYLVPCVAPFGILFLIFMIRVVIRLGVSTQLVRFILVLFFISISIRILTMFFLDNMQFRFVAGLISSSTLLVMQATCVYFMCLNLFLDETPIKEKLWASVCVYFMLAASFGSLYSLLLTINPDAFGVPLSNPMEIYILGMVFSFNVMSGIDPVYDHATETVRMTAVLESILSMLFMVILIGRLLGSKD